MCLKLKKENNKQQASCESVNISKHDLCQSSYIMSSQTKILPFSRETKVSPESVATTSTITSNPTFYRASFTRPPSIPLDLFIGSSTAMEEGITRNPYAHHDSSSPTPKPKCNCEVARHKFTFCADCQQKSIPLLQIAKEEKMSKQIQDEDHQFIVDILSPNEGNMNVTHSTLGAGTLHHFCSTDKMAIATFDCDPCVPKRRIKVLCSKLQEFTDSHARRLRGLGVTIEWLLAFTFDHNCWHRPTWWVNRHIIKEATRHNRRRYMDLDEMKQYARPATIFMSHCWGSQWGDVVLAACHGARFGRVVWIDLFAVRQWGGSGADLNFRGVIKTCAALVVSFSPVDGLKDFISGKEDQDKYFATKEGKAAKKRIPVFRLWCNVEIAAAYKKIPIVIRGGKATKEDNNNTYIYDTKCISALMKNLIFMIDVEASECEVNTDKVREMAVVRSLEGGSKGVNALVAGVVVGGVVSIVTNILEIDAFVCNEPESFRALNIPLGCEGEARKLAIKVLQAAGSGGRESVVKELLLKWNVKEDDDQEKEGETKWNDSIKKEKKGIVFDENDGRLYFVSIHANGVACRNSPAMDDRCSPPHDVSNNECVVGTLTEDGQWICIVESNNAKQNGTFLPMAIPGQNLFKRITTKMEWIALEKEKRRKWLVQLIDDSTVLGTASLAGHVGVVEKILEVVGINVNVDNGGTPLLLASLNGHVDTVKVLLAAKDINVNTPNSGGSGPLWMASEQGHVDTVKVLVAAKGINVNQAGKDGLASLISAVTQGNFEITNVLLQHDNINVNQAGKDGLTPLISAVTKGNFEITNVLLQHENINVNQAGKDGLTPLLCSITQGNLDIAKILLQRDNIDVNCAMEGGITPLLCLIGAGHLDIAKILLQHDNIDVNCAMEGGITPLLIAITGNHLDIVNVLLQHDGIEVNCAMEGGITRGITPLLLAISRGHLDIANVLLQHADIEVNCARNLNTKDINVNTNKNGCTPLYAASEKGHADTVKFLLTAKDINVNKPNRYGCTPLYIASQNGHTDVIQQLLTMNGIDLNKDYKGCTPLYVASQNGHTDVIQQLLTMNGIDLNKDYKGFTPLQKAIKKKHTKIIQLLKDAGATYTVNEAVAANDNDYVQKWIIKEKDINEISELLLHTSLNGNIDIFRLLIAAGGDVNKTNNNEETPLNIASDKGHIQIVRCLLQQPNIDINKRNTRMNSPLVNAKRKKNLEIVQCLMDAGAEYSVYNAVQCNDLDYIEEWLKKNDADVNAVDDTWLGWSLLGIAIGCEHINIVKLLLSVEGIDVNHQVGDVPAPLIVASSQGNVEIVRLLLQEPSIDLDKKFKDSSAFYIAIQQDHNEIVQLLTNAGATPSIKFSRGKKDQAGLHTNQKCTKGHGLIRFNTPHEFGCDLCRQGPIRKDTVMYGCDECNYDICINCEEKCLGETKKNDIKEERRNKK